jgi:hypothetical protein
MFGRTTRFLRLYLRLKGRALKRLHAACDFFDLFVFSAYPISCIFKPPDKIVILSAALRRSIANRGLYSAKSKDPGDA